MVGILYLVNPYIFSIQISLSKKVSVKVFRNFIEEQKFY